MKFLPRLQLIADPSALLIPDDFALYLRVVEDALAGGVRLVQFRAKHLSPYQQWELGRKVAAMCAAYGASLIINDRADLAVILDADGLHLPANGLPVEAAKHLLPNRWIGVSCHSVADVIRAAESGATYATLSPIYAVDAKPGYGPALGTHGLKTAVRASGIRVFALGGLTPDRVPECSQAGAYGVAVMSGVLACANPADAVAKFHGKFG